MTRMREQYIDIELVLPWADVVMAGGFEGCMADLLRKSRDAADRRAEEVNGTVRPSRLPEVSVKQGQTALLGDVFVVTTRWLCDVPEGALTPAER